MCRNVQYAHFYDYYYSLPTPMITNKNTLSEYKQTTARTSINSFKP